MPELITDGSARFTPVELAHYEVKGLEELADRRRWLWIPTMILGIFVTAFHTTTTGFNGAALAGVMLSAVTAYGLLRDSSKITAALQRWQDAIDTQSEWDWAHTSNPKDRH